MLGLLTVDHVKRTELGQHFKISSIEAKFIKAFFIYFVKVSLIMKLEKFKSKAMFCHRKYNTNKQETKSS